MATVKVFGGKSYDDKYSGKIIQIIMRWNAY